jgi:predicted amidohydrolase
VQEAASQGADVLVLPEHFHYFPVLSRPEHLAIAQPLHGVFMSRYREVAKEFGIWLSLGGFEERGDAMPEDKMHLSHVLINSKGDIVDSYRKIHLFDVDYTDIGGPRIKQSSAMIPGTGLTICDSPIGKISLSTCYDLRFPEMYQRLTFEMGAQIHLIGGAFTATTGPGQWDILLKARAIETQSYVAGAAQAGVHNEKKTSHGHSLIADPWGRIVAELPDKRETGIAVAEIDLEEMEGIRRRMPMAQHREIGRKYWYYHNR